MSKYTAEQVLYAAQLEEDTYDGDLIIVQYLRDYAALLRERESAKAAVTDEMVEIAAKSIYKHMKPLRDIYGLHVQWECLPDSDKRPLRETACAALEAVAPMLASAQVPDGMIERIDAAIQRINNGHAPRRIPADPTDVDLVLAEVLAYLKGEKPPFWIAAAPKPEVSERHHWLCCGALKPDHSDKPRVMPDCFDPERHVWAVSPKPETEE